MRKRRLVLYALLFLFLAFVGSFLFSIYTARGTSFLLKGIARVLPGTVEMKKVTGRIGYSLHVEGLRLSLTDLTVQIDTADLKWQPLYLITGKLAIIDLDMHGASITDNKPPEDKPLDLSLPKAPKWLTMLQGWINNLRITDLKYMAPGSKPAVIDELSARVLWRRGILYLDETNLKTPYGTAGGSAMAGLDRPALRASLMVTLRKAAAGIDTLSIDARLPASKGGEQIAGPVIFGASAGKQERLRLECRLAVSRHAVRISQAKLTKKDGKGAIEAEGALDVSGNRPAFTFSARVTGIDLAPEFPVGTNLSGNLDVAGNTEGFKGKLDLRNPGASWKQIELKGNIQGDRERIELKDLEAKLLGGTVLGNIGVSLARVMTLSADLTGKGLDPAKMKPGLEGNLNFELKGQLQIPENLPMEGSIVATLRESRFQKKKISANVDASFSNEIIKINALTAKGNGFTVTAGGIVQKRLSYEIRIDDASRLIPGATGNLFANGWARWLNNEAAGALAARGKDISYGSARVSSFNASLQMPGGYKGNVAVDIKGRGVSYGAFRANTVSLEVSGKMADHVISLSAVYNKDRIDALAEGKYADGAWQGKILKVSGKDPLFGKWGLAGTSTVHVSKKRIGLSPFALTSSGGERIDISADITREPMAGSIALTWQQVNLARMGRLTGQLQLAGRTSGTSRAQWAAGKLLALSGRIDTSGALSKGSMELKVAGANGRLKWDRSGLLASCDVDLGNSGSINTAVSSKEPAAFSLPGKGTFRAAWKALDISTLQPMLPDTVHIKGRLSGEVKGNILPGNRFDLAGRTDISDGSFSWLGGDGEITAPIKKAAVAWTWKETSLKGNVNLALAQYGQAEASFQVPLAAKLPLKMDSRSQVMISTRGSVREKGLLAALFPGLAQETGGQVDFDLTAGGTFEDPRLNGRLSLKGASAYLPPAGIHLKDAGAEVLFNNDLITITSFLLRSWPGSIGGSVTIKHENRGIRAFRGTLKGERFQAVDLPELQASISPDLSFIGSAKKVSVRGSVLIPEALVREERKETLVRPSSDVVIENKKEKPGQALPLAVDVAITVALGDNVQVKAYGIDTRLAGKVDITMKDTGNIRASGNISTVKGKFDAYGVKLDVRRGRIAFGGGPVDQANLNILALRKVNDVSAGVLVTGTPVSPVVNLYSDPPMPDMDILSYVVLGRPRGASGQADTALLARAAGALLTSGKSSAIQKQLGLDVIDVESAGGDVSQSIVRVGKYLSPKLYVSYGRSIYTGENLFGIRYSLSRRVDVESTAGNESSAVIYYKIQFD